MLKHTILVRPNNPNDVTGYSVMVPELPGCFTGGDSFEEALANGKEAIECHLAALLKTGEEIPMETQPFIMVSVEVAEPVPSAAKA